MGDEREMSDDALEKFVDARLELVLTRLRKYLDGIPFEVVDTRSVAAGDGYRKSTSGWIAPPAAYWSDAIVGFPYRGKRGILRHARRDQHRGERGGP